MTDHTLNKLSKLHSREIEAQKAQVELENAVLGWRRNHVDLTMAELISILTHVFSSHLGSIAKYAIRHERHGDADKPGGLE